MLKGLLFLSGHTALYIGFKLQFIISRELLASLSEFIICWYKTSEADKGH